MGLGSTGGRLFIGLWMGMSLLFLVIGGFLVYEQNRALETYEATEATVLETEIDRDRATDPEESDTFEPIVRYRYEVDGETYTSGNVFPGGTTSRSDRGWARGIVNDYDQGDQVTAYYDPDDPSEAYLLKQRDLGKWLFVLMPLLFLVVGALLLWRSTWHGDDSDTDSVTDAGETIATDGADGGGSDSQPAGDTGTAGGNDGDGDGPAGEDGSTGDEDIEYADWGSDGQG